MKNELNSAPSEKIIQVIEKLQRPQTYNEREKLIKILNQAAPAIIKALDETATQGWGQIKTCTDLEERFVKTGETCNGCGHDSSFKDDKPKHRKTGKKRDGTDEEKKCSIEHLYQVLEELEKDSDK